MMTPQEQPAVHPVVIPAEQVPERRGTVAFFSHLSRAGDWILPRSFRVAALLAHAELDLTSAHVGPGTSRIEIMAMMGTITIIVPPELRVECDVDPLIASVEVDRKAQSTTSPDAPTIHITGNVFMASVDVKIVDPNAPGWLDKVRARLAPKNG